MEAIATSNLAGVVHRDPDVMSGALCFAGTRVPVKNLFDYLEAGAPLEEFFEDFPGVKRDQALAVIKAAEEMIVSL